MSIVKSKPGLIRALVVVMSLFAGMISTALPAAALPTVTPSGSGTYALGVGQPANISFTVGNLAVGQTVASYAISPALPDGLTMSTATGVISGTPTTVQASATYTVTTVFATPSETVNDTEIDISVVAVITPTVTTANLQAGTAITPISFTAGGFTGDVTYAVTSGTLPTGLSLAGATGIISGTPQIAQGAASVVITATGATTGSATATITFTVASVISPSTQTVTGTVGTALTPSATFTAFGFTGVVTYTVSPALPSPLVLSSTTGAISGTPTTALAATTYTVTGTDSLGNTDTATISITITAVVAEITPATQTILAFKDVEMTPTATYVKTGFVGAVTFTVSPALPAGLSLSSSTGVVSGTPTALQTATTYTITATGATSGSDTATISITVSARITPATQTLSLTAGNAMTASSAYTRTGFTGAISFTVAPALPAGLSINESTGAVTGTPTTAQAATTYTVTATGATAGSATATISIAIAAKILPATQTVNAAAGTAITATTAFNATGFTGAVTYASSPALPAGLTLNTSTGVVSGIPTNAQIATSYTITATGATAGTATATISISVGTSLTPATTTVNLIQNQAMTATTAFTAAGFVGTVTYAISPALPAGLSFNTSTGVVSGTPTAISASTNYTVTATGSTSGSATARITISVVAPLAAPTTVTATAGDASATITWTSVTGATSYQVVPTPAGGNCTIRQLTAECTNLTNGTSYTFRVTAVNAAGPSSLSTQSNAVIPRVPFTLKTKKITIFFAANSTALPANKAAELRALATQFKLDKGVEGVVTVRGFIPKANQSAAEKRTALARARAAAKILQTIGFKATYTITGTSVVNRTGAKARKVVITTEYKAPNK
jgi:hypothetical protein